MALCTALGGTIDAPPNSVTDADADSAFPASNHAPAIASLHARSSTLRQPSPHPRPGRALLITLCTLAPLPCLSPTSVRRLADIQ